MFIPPIFITIFENIKKVGWHGNYKTWQNAKLNSKGYDAPEIIDIIKNSSLKVKNNEAEFERDGFLFYKPDYNYPILASLQFIALQKNKILNIADFGGALGSVYFQNRKIFSCFKKINWNIIEQQIFVDSGNQIFKDENLKFFNNFDDCKNNSNIDVILFSSVLQYLEKPFEIIADVIKSSPEFILIDRTGFIKQPTHRITVQVVPEYIYSASYPCWFFNEQLFLQYFDNKYNIVFEFFNNDYTNLKKCYFKGFLLQKKND